MSTQCLAIHTPILAQKRLFGFLNQSPEAKSDNTGKKKWPFTPTEEDVLRDHTHTIEACKTRFANIMKSCCVMSHFLNRSFNEQSVEENKAKVNNEKQKVKTSQG